MLATALRIVVLAVGIWQSAAGIVAVPSAAAAAAREDWPAWRGPSGNGVSRETGLPTQWSRTDNIAWTLAMPSFSGSTPILSGSRTRKSR